VSASAVTDKQNKRPHGPLCFLPVHISSTLFGNTDHQRQTFEEKSQGVPIMNFSSTLLFAGLSLACTLALPQPAQDAQRPGQRPQAEGQESHEHRGPPPEALAACKSLARGAACTFTSPHGAETGTCFAPEDKPLACRPTRGAGGSNQPPARDKPKTDKSK
jgi:hypothetical protein